MNTPENPTTDGNGVVVENVSILNDGMLAEIQSFDDALAIVRDVFAGDIIESDKVLGTGFGVADEKAAFVGTPFIILKAETNPSEKGDKGRFWSLHAVTKDGRKVIINDGGSGIAEQMDELTTRHGDLFLATTDEKQFRRMSLAKPMLVKRGLRVSNYTHPQHGPSVTYYLDTSGTV